MDSLITVRNPSIWGAHPSESVNTKSSAENRVDQLQTVPPSLPRTTYSQQGETIATSLLERAVTVDDYRLPYEAQSAPTTIPAKMKRLALQIKTGLSVLGTNAWKGIKSSVSACVILVSGVAGGFGAASGGVAAMVTMSGGLSMGALLPGVTMGAAAAPLGCFIGMGTALAVLVTGGATYGLYKGARYLSQSPEQRFVSEYKQLQSAYKKLTGRQSGFCMESRMANAAKIQQVKAELASMNNEYERILVARQEIV
ncbi:hypothetical protein EOPP23_05565 [Endozoicomonas sp. OPT23]|uniref:hypothetical protein n=1 Tax=Endozoicomonas sp. OPT23 TaxID=2072845 RepID=UPI00129BC2EE|nr:hypothetical protein [Endozoicomonas sp. OPT23]MRI32452.1 hypothetical protein [Endozoicomonas sp. OPT23]